MARNKGASLGQFASNRIKDRLPHCPKDVIQWAQMGYTIGYIDGYGEARPRLKKKPNRKKK